MGDTGYKGWGNLAKYCIVQSSEKLSRRFKSKYATMIEPITRDSFPENPLLTGSTPCNDELETIEGAINLVRAENIELPHLTSYLATKVGMDTDIAWGTRQSLQSLSYYPAISLSNYSCNLYIHELSSPPLLFRIQLQKIIYRSAPLFISEYFLHRPAFPIPYLSAL